MDTLDAKILQQLSHPAAGFQWNVRVSYADVARDLELDPETVRARVTRMEADGIIARWGVAVNPSLLDREVFRVELPPAPDADQAGRRLAALTALDGPHSIFEDHEGGLGIVLFAAPASLPRQLALIESIAGHRPECIRSTIPPATTQLAPADWRVVRALRRGPRRTLEEIAADAACSTRTLRRRIERLVDARAVMLTPGLDASRIRGYFPAEARVVWSSPTARTSSVFADVPRAIFSHSEGLVSRVSFLADGIGEIDALRRSLASNAAIARAQVKFIVRRIFVDGWLDEEIERRAEGSDATRHRTLAP